jgi:hypothetical protein
VAAVGIHRRRDRDRVTGPPAKTKHTTVPQPGLGKFLTFFGRKGQT